MKCNVATDLRTPWFIGKVKNVADDEVSPVDYNRNFSKKSECLTFNILTLLTFHMNCLHTIFLECNKMLKVGLINVCSMVSYLMFQLKNKGFLVDAFSELQLIQESSLIFEMKTLFGFSRLRRVFLNHKLESSTNLAVLLNNRLNLFHQLKQGLSI